MAARTSPRRGAPSMAEPVHGTAVPHAWPESSREISCFERRPATSVAVPNAVLDPRGGGGETGEQLRGGTTRARRVSWGSCLSLVIGWAPVMDQCLPSNDISRRIVCQTDFSRSRTSPGPSARASLPRRVARPASRCRARDCARSRRRTSSRCRTGSTWHRRRSPSRAAARRGCGTSAQDAIELKRRIGGSARRLRRVEEHSNLNAARCSGLQRVHDPRVGEHEQLEVEACARAVDQRQRKRADLRAGERRHDDDGGIGE